MKVLIVNASDIQGGAARAAYRLHRALLASGVESEMLVQSKVSDDYTVLGPESILKKGEGKIRPTLDLIPLRRYKNRTKTLFSPNWVPFTGIADRINKLKPDIVHLHWVAGGMMLIEDIAKIKAPIVWSLHDMWAFTGGCHYDEGCGGFKKSCGNCPVLGSKEAKDLSTKVFSKKQAVFAKIKSFNIIGLSRWLTEEAKSSQLLKDFPVTNLPNPIDINIFSPVEKYMARSLFNLPQDKKLVLFGAVGATSDPRKGFKELSTALSQINDKNLELVVFGSSQPKTHQDFKYKVHYLGNLHDDISLRVLYGASDVMIVPSLQENLSNAIMESLACGLPVVGFNIGGNSDLIEHQVNGYLAQAFDPLELAKGIEWVVNSPNYGQLCQNARDKVLKEFDSRLVVKKYIELYKNILIEVH